MIQFASAFFSDNSLCTLEYSVLAKTREDIPRAQLQCQQTKLFVRPLQIDFLFPVHRPHPQAGVGVAPLELGEDRMSLREFYLNTLGIDYMSHEHSLDKSLSLWFLLK